MQSLNHSLHRQYSGVFTSCYLESVPLLLAIYRLLLGRAASPDNYPTTPPSFAVPVSPTTASPW